MSRMAVSFEHFAVGCRFRITNEVTIEVQRLVIIVFSWRGKTCLDARSKLKLQFLLKVTLYDLNICHICLFDKWGFMMVQSYTSSACIGLYIVSTTLRWHSSASERGWVLISIRTQEGSRCASFRILGSSNST